MQGSLSPFASDTENASIARPIPISTLLKKNIKLNEKKADGSEKTKVGDCVKIFLSDETYSKFVTGVIIPVDGGFSAYSGV